MKDALRDLMGCTLPEGETEHWKIERFEVSLDDEKFQLLRAALNPQKMERYVPAGRYTRLVEKGSGAVIMSDTPDELRDHYQPYQMARGTCLLSGLGLGCLLQGILEKLQLTGEHTVKKAIVLEIDPEVIELVGTHMQKRYGDRLEIRCENAMVYKPPKNEWYDVVWHDIWPDLCADNLDQMAILHRKYGRRCDWQGSWGKEILERQKRREQFSHMLFKRPG